MDYESSIDFHKNMADVLHKLICEQAEDEEDNRLLDPAIAYLRSCMALDATEHAGTHLKHYNGNPTMRVAIIDPDSLEEILFGPEVHIIPLIVNSMSFDADHMKWRFYSEFTKRLRDALGLKDSAQPEG